MNLFKKKHEYYTVLSVDTEFTDNLEDLIDARLLSFEVDAAGSVNKAVIKDVNITPYQKGDKTRFLVLLTVSAQQ
jgi:hypothetical protein